MTPYMWLLRNILFYLSIVVVFQVASSNYLNNSTVWFTHYVVNTALVITGLIVILKWKIKWTGINTLNRNSGKYNFIFNKPLQPGFVYWTKFHVLSEMIASFAFGITIGLFEQTAWIFSLILIINGIENAIFLYINLKNNRFRVAVNEYAVVHNGRGTYVIPFHELQSIERKYEEFFFIYKNGDTLTLPLNAMTENDLIEFRQLIENKAREKEIFCSTK